MTQPTEYVKATEIKVGDILTHPYTTWTVTKVSVNAGRYTLDVTPSNPSYETTLTGWGDAIFSRQSR